MVGMRWRFEWVNAAENLVLEHILPAIAVVGGAGWEMHRCKVKKTFMILSVLLNPHGD